jgi:hypothetical protein
MKKGGLQILGNFIEISNPFRICSKLKINIGWMTNLLARNLGGAA